LGIALVSDIRISTEHATFGLPEILVGIPSVLDTALLQQHVGLSKAKEMILTGERYPASEMASYGLLNAVVPDDELIRTTEIMTARFANHSKTAVSAQKRIFEAWQNTAHTAGVEVTIEVFASVFAERETAEQMALHSRRVTGRE
jgi:enoyl-CoA hydratase